METPKPYEKFNPADLILRDELAIDRTLLSNERTLMAYIRLGITLVIAGVTIIHFSMTLWFHAFGMACIPSGVLVGLFGVARFRKMNNAISLVRRKILTRDRTKA